MNSYQWPQQQEIVVKPIEEIIIPKQQQQHQQQQKPRPQQKEQNLNCPRCNSTNTKFCYYNNYSLTQPRYFCKTCRRYWTNGGSLRNIPVGGGSRKNKRPSSSSNTSSPSKKQDLNLTFPISTHQDFTSFSHHEFAQMTKMPSSSTPTTTTITSTTNTNIPQHHLSHLELLNGFSGTNTCGSSRGFGSFMHVGTNIPISTTNNVGKIRDLQHEDDMEMNNMVNYNASSGFHDHMQGLKQSSLNFTLDHHDGNIGGSGGYDRNFQNGAMQESNNNVNASSDGRVLFPFEDLKQQASSINTSAQEHDHAASSGYWTGMLGGGSW